MAQRDSELAMLDSIARRATAKIEDLRRQLAAKEMFLAEIREMLAEIAGKEHDFVLSGPNGDHLIVEAKASSRTDQLATKIAKWMRERPPVSLGEIVAMLEREGENADGKQSLTNVVFGVLRRRSNIFTNPSRGVYALANP